MDHIPHRLFHPVYLLLRPPLGSLRMDIALPAHQSLLQALLRSILLRLGNPIPLARLWSLPVCLLHLLALGNMELRAGDTLLIAPQYCPPAHPPSLLPVLGGIHPLVHLSFHLVRL